MKVAVVTGVWSGIGQATAAKLAQIGYRTFGTVRGDFAPRSDLELVRVDVRDRDSVEEGVASVFERAGRIDVLVNSAGSALIRAAEETSIDEAHDLFQTNVFGVMRMTQAVLPAMRAQRSGRIINISSVLGFLPAPFMSAYAATKHAVEATPNRSITKSAILACASSWSSPDSRERTSAVTTETAIRSLHTTWTVIAPPPPSDTTSSTAPIR